MALKTTRRQVLTGTVAVGGALGLAACGAQGGGTPETTAPSKLAGTLEFWQWGTSYEEGFNKLAAEFNEKMSGAKVNHTRPEGYDDKIKVTVAAGSGAPDVYLMRGTNIKQWAQDGIAVDITQYVSRDKAAANDIKALHKNFYDFYHHNGKVHGIPWDFSTIMVAYSLEAMESRGLKPPAELGPGWDWNTFMDYAKLLTEGNRFGVEAIPGIEKGFYNWVVANGGDYWSEDYKKCTVNTPQFLEACEAYFSLATRLNVTPPRATKSAMTQGLPHESYLLVNGNAAMQTAGDWHFVWYERAAQTGFRWDVAPHPYAPRTKKTGSIANYRGLTVAPTTQNKELAWAWIANLIKREVQDRVPTLMGEVPARLDSIDQVYLNPAKMASPKNRKLLKASIDATKPLPANPYLAYSDINSATNALAQDAYDGKKQVKEAVEEIQTKLSALLGTR